MEVAVYISFHISFQVYSHSEVIQILVITKFRYRVTVLNDVFKKGMHFSSLYIFWFDLAWPKGLLKYMYIHYCILKPLYVACGDVSMEE